MRILHTVDWRFGQTLGGKGDPTTALSIDECFGSLDAESLDITMDLSHWRTSNRDAKVSMAQVTLRS